MKMKATSLMMIWCVSLFAAACGGGAPENEQILAKVNEYKMTLGEFEEQLVAELEFQEDFKATLEARRELLDQMITEELLIQEAMRRKLDREKKFIKSIERYWKSTLIRDLMETVGSSFEKNTFVTQEEIEAFYEKIREKETSPPSREEYSEVIERQLMEEKKEKKFNAWIEKLKKAAEIEIDESLL